MAQLCTHVAPCLLYRLLADMIWFFRPQRREARYEISHTDWRGAIAHHYSSRRQRGRGRSDEPPGSSNAPSS